MVCLLQARVRDDQLPAVEHVVAPQPVQEGRHRGPELGRLRVKLGQRLGEPVGGTEVPEPLGRQAPQRAAQLVPLAVQHPGREVPVRALPIAFGAHPLGQVEHDRDR